jgi:hypothetical protein
VPPWPALRSAAAEHGLHLGIWQSITDPWRAEYVYRVYQPDSFVVEAERGMDWAELARLLAPYRCPKAVVTNFAPFTRPDGRPDAEAARPLVDAGWRCLVECDLPANPRATPERLDWEARLRGWGYGQPVIYLYGGKTLADYGDMTRWPGWAAWSAEYVL